MMILADFPRRCSLTAFLWVEFCPPPNAHCLATINHLIKNPLPPFPLANNLIAATTLSRQLCYRCVPIRSELFRSLATFRSTLAQPLRNPLPRSRFIMVRIFGPVGPGNFHFRPCSWPFSALFATRAENGFLRNVLRIA